jgi:hypothetical protein
MDVATTNYRICGVDKMGTNILSTISISTHDIAGAPAVKVPPDSPMCDPIIGKINTCRGVRRVKLPLSVAPDPRIPPTHEEFRRIKGADFEIVVPPTDR